MALAEQRQARSPLPLRMLQGLRAQGNSLVNRSAAYSLLQAALSHDPRYEASFTLQT